MIIPYHSHIPDPRYVEMLDGKKIFLDVGTLLRAILFPQSHSARLMEHIELSRGSIAKISFHVRNKALSVLESNYPSLVETFVSGILTLISRGNLEVVSDGNANRLPPDVCYDDDIVIASALDSKCDILSTLDHQLALHASRVIEVLPPSQPECSKFQSTLTTIDVRIYSTPTRGSIMMEVSPMEGSVGYSGGNGRRYVFCSNGGFGCWLKEGSWNYQIGFVNRREPLFVFNGIDPEKIVAISASYNCDESILTVGWMQEGNDQPDVRRLDNVTLPEEIGSRWNILGREGQDSFNGYWRGVLSTAQFADIRAMRYSLNFKSHFEPLDCQRFPLSDAIMEAALIIRPDNFN